ncbi:poly(A) RNA polymerase gld-2 homolog B-like isoform X1 [Toxorhynchites rutilus septentrionalis]|uniref:poly(A) RNA polymerase gld-2 homolog B-like isoform X1 n=1 Tax=Toxorhynchites rutilus septentrionalis TaxID=329112 RepID=UPI0024789785|nr:poly(A) RNA polymerase gld-2 homolog B-like isoform X1 [Toxorhynchites rutilus septentrionalis]XP_055636809.1 poly(A) RNA polymerase gld-2 homolog B-like isoform X1 [Toxorhynchites rutilus septentrionalis]XP_055636810.1 poly(A) RNA polymerase gld-2 homolog B-like isoform X1 [Toxorhynchites rutilus septentrionalis]
MSTKKMHPPAVIHSTGQSGGKGSLLPTVGGGKITRDRQNVENIVPSPKGYSGNGDAQANNHNATNQNSGGKKMSNKASVVSSNSCKTQAGSTMSAMATLNSNRRKNHRLNSPGRKAQDQQQIFNSLKAWNVKFTSSTSSKASALEKREFSPVGSTNAEGGSKNETGRTSTECVTGGGLSSVGSNTSSNSSIISNSIISTTSSLKNKKQSLQMMSSATATSQIVKETSVAGKAQVLKKKEDVESNSSQSTYNVDLKTGDSSAPVILCESVGKIGAGQTATTTVKGDRKPTNAGGGFSANHRNLAVTSSSSLLLPSSTAGAPASLSSPFTSHSLSTNLVSSSSPSPTVPISSPVSNSKFGNVRQSNVGKVLLPNVNPLTGTSLDPLVLLQGKLRNSLKLDSFVTTPQTHHISHHHSANSHLQGRGQQQQQNGQQAPPTTPPHYSLDFLHYVGMRMSNANCTSQAGNPSTTSGSTIYRSSPHFTYNHFNQQLHQPQIMHQQPQQQSHQHNQRQYTNYYNSDDLLITTSGGGEQVYANFNMTDRLMNGNNVSSSGNCGSANETCIAYCYSQNHQHLHHPNHPTHQHAYSNGAHQSYHQNNNYQSHNRNYGRNGQNGQHNGNGNSTNGNRRAWNNNWHNGKHGKHNGKGPGFFRRNHQFYNNNHHTNGNHHYDYQTDHVRNLVYIRGSHDRDQTAPPPVEQENISRSPTPSPQSVSPAIDVVETSQVGSNGNTPMHDEKSDSGIEEVVRNLKKSGVVPSSSSSSSSMVSIPSTDSSAVSSSVSQNLSLDLNCINGQGYESDSSHSSSYNSHVYRHRKYANGGHVYRSSSSTSSGVSSTATYPPLNSSSSTDAPTTSSSQVTDFFLRSQSYHGSHQNLESTSGNASPNLPDSPIGTPRSMVANQPLPMFSELFTGKHRSHQQQQQQQHQTINYICNNSLELHTAASGNSPLSTSNHNTSSSNHSYSGAPPSTVPPNETYSMQSGHPKRHYSGRQSPSTSCSSSQKAPLSTGLSSHTAETASSQHQQHQSSQNEQLQLSPILHINRKNQTAWGQNRSDTTMPISTASSGIVPDVVMQAAPTALPPPTAHPMSFPNDTSNIHTPADRFLARSHQVELRVPSQEIAPKGCKWASLSTAIWDKFAAAQQTEQKFIQKIHLWRYLFMCIRKVFPRLGLYLVGSTMSGFASDSSDVDMCLISRANVVPYDMRGEALYQLGQIKNYFMNIPIYFEEFSLIQAKVPILRFRDRANLIVVDLNYNNCVGIRNTHLLHCYSQMDWRLRPLVLVVKLWAQHHNINDAKNMTISSYSLVLMVIHFLQFGVGPPILPCLHAMFPDKFARMSDISNLDMMEEMEPYKNDNNMSLGELFLQFLEYYANFDYAQYAISVRTGSVIPIETARLVRSYRNDPHHWRQLCIEEPFELTNTARSVFDADIFEQIKSVFSVCWKRLKETNDLSSVFECDPLFIPVASTLSLTS